MTFAYLGKCRTIVGKIACQSYRTSVNNLSYSCYTCTQSHEYSPHKVAQIAGITSDRTRFADEGDAGLNLLVVTAGIAVRVFHLGRVRFLIKGRRILKLTEVFCVQVLCNVVTSYMK